MKVRVSGSLFGFPIDYEQEVEIDDSLLDGLSEEEREEVVEREVYDYVMDSLEYSIEPIEGMEK